ncbi:hypothetical protein HX037_09360 [Ignatzschineria indica]|nr:hypothetical protein [Ignatzschineria indica]
MSLFLCCPSLLYKFMRNIFLKSIVRAVFTSVFMVFLAVANAAIDYHPPLEGESSDKLLINVERDRKIGGNGQLTESSCPIELYINGQKVGSYLINEHQQYYLSPGDYSFRVENCLGQSSIYDMTLQVNDGQYYQDYILSVDFKGKPFIIKNSLQRL